MALTGSQLYWQAMRKASLQSKRNVRHMMEGKRDDSGPAGCDLRRDAIIKEFDRLLATQERLER